MARKTDACKIWFGRLTGRGDSEDLAVAGRTSLKQILGKRGLGCGLDSFVLG
jgi:hypothetical protein